MLSRSIQLVQILVLIIVQVWIINSILSQCSLIFNSFLQATIMDRALQLLTVVGVVVSIAKETSENFLAKVIVSGTLVLVFYFAFKATAESQEKVKRTEILLKETQDQLKLKEHLSLDDFQSQEQTICKLGKEIIEKDAQIRILMNLIEEEHAKKRKTSHGNRGRHRCDFADDDTVCIQTTNIYFLLVLITFFLRRKTNPGENLASFHKSRDSNVQRCPKYEYGTLSEYHSDISDDTQLAEFYRSQLDESRQQCRSLQRENQYLRATLTSMQKERDDLLDELERTSLADSSFPSSRISERLYSFESNADRRYGNLDIWRRHKEESVRSRGSRSFATFQLSEKGRSRQENPCQVNLPSEKLSRGPESVGYSAIPPRPSVPVLRRGHSLDYERSGGPADRTEESFAPYGRATRAGSIFSIEDDDSNCNSFSSSSGTNFGSSSSTPCQKQGQGYGAAPSLCHPTHLLHEERDELASKVDQIMRSWES